MSDTSFSSTPCFAPLDTLTVQTQEQVSVRLHCSPYASTTVNTAGSGDTVGKKYWEQYDLVQPAIRDETMCTPDE